MPLETLDEIRNPDVPLEDRWRKFQPYWEEIQNTGYARSLSIAVKGLYGVDGLSGETYLELVKRMNEANRSGLYEWVLKEKARIDLAILDPGSDCYDVTGIDRGSSPLYSDLKTSSSLERGMIYSCSLRDMEG
jgi:hypothetical protein